MHVCKIVSFSVVILLVAVLLAGVVTILPAPQPAAAQPSNVLSYQSYNGPFVGSKNSNVYHYPSCYHVNAILPANRITFNTLADACNAGYRPCKDCNPPPCGAPTPTPTPKPTPTPTPKPTPTPTPKPTPTPTPKPTPTPTPSLAGTSPTPTLSRAETSPTPSPSLAGASPSTTNLPQATASQSSQSRTPGFEALYALGALAAVFLAFRVTRRS